MENRFDPLLAGKGHIAATAKSQRPAARSAFFRLPRVRLRKQCGIPILHTRSLRSSVHFFASYAARLAAARILAQRARWAVAIRLRAAADILRAPRRDDLVGP